MILSVFELLSILSISYPTLFGYILPSPPVASQLIIDPTFILGSSFVVGGTLLRVACFRHLGKYFTFNLLVKKDHKLITDGPYAIVRHPSYTGMIVVVLFAGVCQFGPGSWWNAFGLWECFAGKLVGGVFVLAIVLTSLITVQRTTVEDSVLRDTFKDEWLAWSVRTPWKLIPFVL